MLKRWHVLLLDAALISLIPIAYLLTQWMMVDMGPCYFLERGIQCPSCGGTRCVMYLSQFQFISAFKMNPFFFITAMICLAMVILLNISVFFNWNKGWNILKKVAKPYSVIIWAIGYAVFGMLRILL